MFSMITNSSVSKAGNGSGSSLVENYKARLQAQNVSRGMPGRRIRTIKQLIRWLSVNPKFSSWNLMPTDFIQPHFQSEVGKNYSHDLQVLHFTVERGSNNRGQRFLSLRS